MLGFLYLLKIILDRRCRRSFMFNKKFFILLVTFSISACVHNSNQDEIAYNAKLSECDVINPSPKIESLTARDFALKMEFTASNVQMKRETYKLLKNSLNQRLASEMINEKDFQDVSNKMNQCFYTNLKVITLDMPEYFEKIKRSTKNAKQKDALIKAYSNWEVYVDQSPHANNIEKKTNFEKKLAFYKNVL